MDLDTHLHIVAERTAKFGQPEEAAAMREDLAYLRRAWTGEDDYNDAEQSVAVIRDAAQRLIETMDRVTDKDIANDRADIAALRADRRRREQS